jgi:hypothetical protein
MQPNRTLLVLGFLLASASVATAEPATMSDQEATIMTMGADHMMKPIREGSNGWTCMDPGGAPMCADKAAMEWIQAWQEKGPAPQKIGFIYMLKGDGGTSNTDRYGTRDTADIGAGGDLSWPKPTRPGDILHVESEVQEIIPSRSRPDRGAPLVRIVTRNQRDEVVQVLVARLIVPRRT